MNGAATGVGIPMGHDVHAGVLRRPPAAAALRAAAALADRTGATHLFDEPGTVEQVAELAGAGFVKHLGAESHAP